MEQSTAVADETAVDAPTEAAPGEPGGPEASPAEQRDTSRMFEFSREVHIGPGAEECPEASNGSCTNPMHFHAFIRLPNQFQHASLREKADAAKARKLRALRDPESDSRVILDGELEELVRVGDKEVLVDQIANASFLKDQMAAMREVAEEEEFKTIEDDRERLRVLRDMADVERPQEEFEELERHVLAYTERVNEARDRIQQPLRESLEEKPIDELINLVREERIQAIAREHSDMVFSQWEWYVGTLKVRVPEKVSAPQERVFKSIDHMLAAPPEVIDALALGFREIEAAAGRSLQRLAYG